MCVCVCMHLYTFANGTPISVLLVLQKKKKKKTPLVIDDDALSVLLPQNSLTKTSILLWAVKQNRP